MVLFWDILLLCVFDYCFIFSLMGAGPEGVMEMIL